VSAHLTAESPLIGSASSRIRSDAHRAGVLAAIRRMTVLFLAGMPTLVVAAALLAILRWADWMPAFFIAAGAVTVLVGFASFALWRRLGRLSDLTAMNEELRYRATHDLLMKIPNRDLLHVELTAALDAGAEAPGSVGLLFLDLDRFKFVNDTLGHAAGDELLKAVGRRIERALLPENAVLARVGGDELVVLMRCLTSIDHLGLVAGRLLSKFVDPFTIDGVKLSIGTSIGMAVSVAGESAGELYRHADAALYEAKERGRGRAVLADANLRALRDTRVRTELALRDALTNHEIEAWFQPEVNLVTGEVVAAEALARWRKDNGVEAASTFINVARRAGMLEELMVDMADQVWTWRDASGADLPIAINVSAVHLPTLLAMHRKNRKARPFEGMRIEIAETDIIHDFEGARAILDCLRSLGARVMLDDFGAGYSSLQMLSDLPIDGIKIDRSYTARIETDLRVRNLVMSLAEFARSTNMIVVAEGVETRAQVEFLTQIGIDRGQGYLFSRAVDPDRFAKMIERGDVDADLVSVF